MRQPPASRASLTPARVTRARLANRDSSSHADLTCHRHHRCACAYDADDDASSAVSDAVPIRLPPGRTASGPLPRPRSSAPLKIERYSSNRPGVVHAEPDRRRSRYLPREFASRKSAWSVLPRVFLLFRKNLAAPGRWPLSPANVERDVRPRAARKRRRRDGATMWRRNSGHGLARARRPDSTP